ncbi:uncharacterized protein K452DRAFT_132704 [Aplosporella prunicola CBS 121167]|uniref:Uncharacterized protein n=1 Tax=Aplosporella prunicola CBS 121167 TaxID=1176127 RepID=A0A6A6BQT0_9PEZI|nr:uncharacterized protein K452DRAFT_132704 [Aplosporella prunicola CBS 121167]KAF2144941.1 hypothetical protein K452DRAFT_132704 [Aplosporella prunicola CBS 121167]
MQKHGTGIAAFRARDEARRARRGYRIVMTRLAVAGPWLAGMGYVYVCVCIMVGWLMPLRIFFKSLAGIMAAVREETDGYDD